MKPELSIAFQTDKKIDVYGPIARKVEKFGFDRISVYNDLLYQPAWYPLFEIAQATNSILLGPAAVNPFTSHPINIAGNISLLNEKSKGRAYLGLAKGAWLDYIGINPKNSVTQLHHSLKTILHFLSNSGDPLVQKYFPINGSESLRWEQYNNSIPLMLGSWGLKTIARCHQLIQEIKLGGTANPGIVEVYRKKLDELSPMRHVGIAVGAVCVIDKDAELAKIIAKNEIALYLPVIMELDTTLKISNSTIEGIKLAMNENDTETAITYISDDLLSKFAFAGAPEDILKQTIGLYESGASRVELGTPHGTSMNKGVDLLGNKVVPAVKEYIGEKFGQNL